MAIIKFILSLTLPSLWFFINAIFMIVLSFARFFSIRDYRKIKFVHNRDEIQNIGYKNYLNNGILLVVLGIMYFFVNVYIYYKGTKTNTIKFNTDGGNKIGNIIVENGKVISLPINPTKTGYAFAGWVDENGNSVTKDTIINKNMTIKAL